MKKIQKYAAITCLIGQTVCATVTVFDAQLVGSSFFSPRSISTDAARDLVGWHRFLHRTDTECFYGATEFTAGYARSFRSRRLAEYFWGSDILTITGSQVTPRAFNNILADYFGLSPAFSSTAFLNPILQTAYLDCGFYGGWGAWYLYAHAPIAWTSAAFNIRERIENNGQSTPFPAGYMDVGAVTAPYTSWAQALSGSASFGQVEALQFGKISCLPRTKVALSDTQIAVGYDLCRRESGHAGFNLRLTLPTGNKPTSEFLLDATVGNGKHWEAGLGFTGSVIIWEEAGTQRADFFFDMNAMHLFRTTQLRSFDFIENGFGSRYILLKQFQNGLYTGTTVPAINLTTLYCDVSNAIQFDIALMFGYQNKGFNFDIGCNGWLRSRDLICLKQDPFATAQYGFKGIQNEINLDSTTYSTQSRATLHGNNFADQLLVMDPNSPVFISPGSIDPESAASPIQVTLAIFWNLGHTWYQHKGVQPFLSTGGKVEFEGVRPKEVQPSNNTMSQWQLWIKGGFGW